MDNYVSNGDVWKKGTIVVQVIGRVPLPEGHKELLVQNLRSGLISEIDEDELYLEGWVLMRGGILNLSNMMWRVISEDGINKTATIEADGRGVGILDSFKFEMDESSNLPALTLKFPVMGGLELGIEKSKEMCTKNKEKE